MRLFVTGATGFIGSYFVELALKEGHSVFALKRNSNSKPRFELDKEPQWVEKKLEDVIESDLENIDVLVHMAAVGITPQPVTWEECYVFNVVKSLNLFRMAAKAGVRRIVITGSYSEFGKSGLRYDYIPSNAPLEPTDPYAASKASASIAASALCCIEKFELCYLRLFSVFGEGQFGKNFWPSLKYAALSGADFPMTLGEQIRDFIPVEEAVRLILFSCTRKDIIPGESYFENIGSGRPQSLREFADYWWKKWKAKGKLLPDAIHYRKDEVMRYVPQIRSTKF
jgi:nucleoside-diphosphate-sugar epimerase